MWLRSTCDDIIARINHIRAKVVMITVTMKAAAGIHWQDGCLTFTLEVARCESETLHYPAPC